MSPPGMNNEVDLSQTAVACDSVDGVVLHGKIWYVGLQTGRGGVA